MGRIVNCSSTRRRPSKLVNKMKNAALVKKKQQEIAVTNVSVESAETFSESDVNHTLSDKISPVKPSASANKLSKFTDVFPVEQLASMSEEENCTYMLVHKSVWEHLLKGCVCAVCGSSNVCIEVKQSVSFAHQLVSKCNNCEQLLNKVSTSPRVPVKSSSTRPPFEVNRKIVDAFLKIGRGHSAIEQFSIAIGLPSMNASTYNAHVLAVTKNNVKMKEEILRLSHAAIREAYMDVLESDHDEVVNLSVSYDGTWQKRGHTSHYGMGIVIDILTGLVVDFHVLSKYCGTCEKNKMKLGEKSSEYKKWKEDHDLSGECDCNFHGSSNAMEEAASEILWKRSLSHNFRYMTILSDGDAKTYNHLMKLNVYGDNFIIRKEECINHVSKRLKTGLKKIIQEWKVKGVTLGGKKQGNLKEDIIIRLGNYYRNAIQKNIPDVQKMKSAIFATLYHAMSTDLKPQHFKCPKEKDSWCFYNRAIALGNEIPKHDKNSMKTVLSSSVVCKIIPVYQRLANNELLERCVSGKTQNANESLHSVVWSKCPKETFVSRKKVEIAVTSAVSQFNMGCEATERVKEHVTGMKMTPPGKKISIMRDKRRLHKSAMASQPGFKSCKKRLKMLKSLKEEKKKDVEGAMYASGQF